MKIIIISVPRSGSTSLMFGLSESLQLSYYFQPFNKLAWNGIIQSIDKKNNYLVKTMVDETPVETTNPVKFYTDYSKSFDKIILLSRKDIILCAESLGYNLKHHNNKRNAEHWHKEYFYSDNGIDLDTNINYLKNLNKYLNELSVNLNVEIDYYEDIFSNNVTLVEKFVKRHNLDCDINVLMKHVNPVNKLRKGTITEKKIL